jgi:hypothetical protein
LKPTPFLLAGLALALAAAPLFAQTGTDLRDRHLAAGRALDTRYRDAGRRVDMAAYDLEDLAAQSATVPAGVSAAVKAADTEMRARWQKLDAQREAVYSEIVELPPPGAHLLRLDDLETLPGSGNWFGIRSARLEWADGTKLDLPPKSFQNGAFKTGYNYLVEPADSVFIYSRASNQYLMQAAFEMPPNAKGEAKLVLSAVDGDAPGQTRIRVTLDGTTVFEGDSPFPSDKWGEHAFAVPAAAFRARPSGSDVSKVAADLDRLDSDIVNFGQWADATADRIERDTRATRNMLDPKPLDIAPDFWKHHFVRGVCYVPFTQEYRHHFRGFRHLGANMLYSYTGHYNSTSEFPATMDAVRATGLPYFQFTYTLSNGSTDTLRLGDPGALAKDARAFIKRVEGDSGVRVDLAVDEPNFRDVLATEPKVLAAFQKYLAARRPVLAAAGIEIAPDARPLLKLEKPEDRPLWMEWQMFKAQYLPKHMRALWDAMGKDNRVPFIIVQDHQPVAPQMASWVHYGAALPWISTDLYNDGAIREAYGMDLLKNATAGKAILTGGAGYSDKTADRFRRTIAVGMAHADGFLQWTDVYFNKYRDSKAYWNASADDQGRGMLQNWRPEYWTIMEDTYAQMKAADAWLTDTRTVDTVAVLTSERTAISDSATNGAPYFQQMLGVYSDLMRQGLPVEARYVENLTPEALARLKVLVLPDARVLLPEEQDRLRAWVKSGGTLIASADTSLSDAWGRPRNDFGLADLFGANRVGKGSGARSFTAFGQTVEVSSSAAEVVRVRPNGAAVVAAWDNGDPALLRNDYGQGRAFLLTLRNIGARTGATPGPNGLAGEGWKGFRELLAKMIGDVVPAPPVTISGLPDGVEVQVRQKGNAYVLHLTDWMDERTVEGIRIRPNMPGSWTVFDPTTGARHAPNSGDGSVAVAPLRVHQMIVVQAAGSASR